MNIKSMLLILLLAVAGTSFAGEADGPFGLSWGMTKAEVEKLGVKLELKSTRNDIELFKTTSLPKNLSIAESYLLSFDKKRHLQRVEMLSKDIDEDAFGTQGKKTFSSIRASLVKKYGKPTDELERVGVKLYKNPDEFYQCLAYDGCGLWVALFATKGISLELKGLERGKGFIDLTYEGPKWSDVVNDLKNRQLKSDEGAL